MYPVLLDLGPIKIYSFGLMLALGFFAGSSVLTRELRRRKLDPELGTWITIIAVVGGIGGAKILHLIENLDLFLRNPISEAFSPGGLTWYGGFVLALGLVSWYVRKKRVPLLRVWDCLGIALMIGYGVGRVGCHLAGDGDYGIPTHLPWGTVYAEGIVKPSLQLRPYFDAHPDERARWNYDSLRIIRGGLDRRGMAYSRFDVETPLHPAPIYEFFLGLTGYLLLLRLQRRARVDGLIFMAYLALSGAFRFAIEFIRLNPRLAAGLTEAQWFGLAMILIGALGAVILIKRSRSATAG
jgi:phosphatidylglycerol---prolipoprotein diacylglyceryl transferase